MPMQHTPKRELNRQPRARLDEAEIEVESKPITTEDYEDQADDEGTTVTPQASESRDDVSRPELDQISEVLRRSVSNSSREVPS